MKKILPILFAASLCTLPSQLGYASDGAENQILYHVDSSLSEVLVTVRRDGLMARLGHNHIVASHQLQGSILLKKNNDPNGSQFSHCQAQFQAPLASLIVDNPQQRAEAGFKTIPSAEDIANTTRNMLTSVDAQNFPLVQLHSYNCLPALGGKETEAVIFLHGVKQNLWLAMDIEQQVGRMILRGNFTLRQSDFAIEPFSVLGGLLRVEDKLELSFTVTVTEAEKNGHR